MSSYIKPQNPLYNEAADVYIYPLTTVDQIVLSNGERLNESYFGKGIELNYSIIGGLEEPENPTENMIWVETDVNITNHIISKNEPKNPEEGMVWIYNNNASNVNFYKLKYGDMGVDEVYPISAKQYVGGAWVDKTAKSYQGGKWVDWYGGELYKNGKEYEHITGGWMTSSYDGSAGGTVTKNENNITLSANSNGFAITVTGKSINLNGKSKLKVLFDSMNTVPQASRAVAVSLHSGATPTSNNRIAQELTQSNKTELTLDTSTQSGSYWVAVRCQYGATATFSEVVLE